MGKIQLPPGSSVAPREDEKPAIAGGTIAAGVIDAVDPKTGQRSVLPALMLQIYGVEKGKRAQLMTNIAPQVHEQLSKLIAMAVKQLESEFDEPASQNIACPKCAHTYIGLTVERGVPGTIGLLCKCASCGHAFAADARPFYRSDMICKSCGATWAEDQSKCPKCRSKKTETV
jgi:hypothetical protein